MVLHALTFVLERFFEYGLDCSVGMGKFDPASSSYVDTVTLHLGDSLLQVKTFVETFIILLNASLTGSS